MTPKEAYTACTNLLLAAQQEPSPADQYCFVSLALLAALHPALQPFRENPMCKLDDQFLSLDAQTKVLQSFLAQQNNIREIRGAAGGVLYLPATRSAVACRLCTAYLSSLAQDYWERPMALQEVSPALHESAQKAFTSALHIALFLYPGDVIPTPAPVYWGIQGVPETLLQGTVGNSLELPLTLAFLSALTGLPIASPIGATGGVRFPETILSVSFVAKKRDAYKQVMGANARFYTPEDSKSVTEIVAQFGEAWNQRFRQKSINVSLTILRNETPTFLWAEIENAPVFWATCAGKFRAALPRYETLFTNAIHRYKGESFISPSGGGESLGAVFNDAEVAVQAAIYLFRSLRSAIWDPALGATFPVRIGIHRGSGERVNGIWRGTGPAQALRIAGAASTGQILVSEAVHAFVKDTCTWVLHGAHRLRDLPEPVVLWQVIADGLSPAIIPPESLETHYHNRQIMVTPLIGRAAEVESLVQLLTRERLITLTGIGGVGKTRLAIAAAEQALLDPATRSRFLHGAIYVSLDTIPRSTADVWEAIRSAMGVSDISSRKDQRLLLVLDNVERIAEGVAEVVPSLLKSMGHLSVLVTSRTPLHVRGEKRVGVLPLALPKPESEKEAWQDTDAFQLFLDRARFSDKEFFVTDAEQETVLRLLQRLDGLPLAIELAAARVRWLSVSEIEARLSVSFALLATRERGIPERQRTLQATLEWSYNLLAESEKSFLRSLCIFAGSFDVSAVEDITADGSSLDRLTTLEEHSLILCERSGNGGIRFSLLQIVADFLREKWVENPAQQENLRKAHCRYFVAFARQNGGEAVTRSPQETQAFDRLDQNMPNLRAVWSYLQTKEDFETIANFAANLADFLRRRGHSLERSQWLEVGLSLASNSELQQRLRYAWALTLMETGRLDEALVVAQLFSNQTREAADKAQQAMAHRLTGTISLHAKRYAEADMFFLQAEALYTDIQDKQGLANVWNNRAVNAIRLGDILLAKGLSEQARELCSHIGDEHGEAYAHNNLGYLLSREQDYPAAIVHYQHQLQYCRSRSDTLGCAVSLFNIGEALLYQNSQEGLSLILAASEIFSRLGHPYFETATTDTDNWAKKTQIMPVTLANLRRAASRRALADLRQTTIPHSAFDTVTASQK